MRISIVLPSLNQVQWLRGCLDSILSQNYPDLELIVMDGGSTDGSVEIIKSYSDRIAYWHSGPDGGQYRAIEDGFERATGDVFAWLNADDLYLPWTLRTVASIFEQLPAIEWLTSTQPSVVSGAGEVLACGASRSVSKEAFLEGLYIPRNKKSLGVVVQEGTFWRRSLWERTVPRFTEDAPLAGDFELWCRFFMTADLHNLALPLAAMTQHSGQRSNDGARYHAEASHVLSQLRSNMGLPSTGSWRRTLAQFGFGKRLGRILARKLCNFPVHLVTPERSTESQVTTWAVKTLPLW
jgi:hypothetical protein